MTTPPPSDRDRDCDLIIDPPTEIGLADVGLDGYTIAETVDRDGQRQAWIVARHHLADVDDHRDVDHGAVEAPPHERLGPLPDDLRDRVAAVVLRCGRPTASGRPCRARVAEPGAACGAHREVHR
ncbi:MULTISPECIES: hypothetical protein [unclassified Gordonia (in: high G+C Gram-positive bacteria)]|uniref:hypothetical protein n=1 Tax=unclassified Gordonia (in: high G+C Gram-positive bacteria) TaxID=2657482 RepID=UPI0011129AF7|nr:MULTISPECIES: hypothetical protein [unclassified Gordonia (in: high G+C Gram-positive bacteria)]